MTHTTLRPYTKAVVISALGTSAIELRDTSDTLLECNYIRVNTYGTPITTAIPDFIVFLSGVDGLTTPSVSPVTVTPTASGFCGVAGQAEGVSPVEIFLDDQDKVSEIQIFNAAADSITYVITYGNIRFINPMRFNDRPKGS